MTQTAPAGMGGLAVATGPAAIGGPIDVALQYGYDTPSGIVLEVGDLADPSITEWPIGTAERVSL